MSKHLQNINMALTPDLRYVQLDSFCHLLLHLLPLELKKLNDIAHQTSHFNLRIFGIEYRLEHPKYNPKEAILHNANYACNVYVPVSLYHREDHIREIQTVCLGSFPLMTMNAAFIINGISRCIVSQLIRSPGLYYTLNSENHYIATIISNSGKRLKLKYIDDAVWVLFQNNATVPLVTLLLAFGLDIKYIPLKLHQPSTSFIAKTKQAFPRSVEGAIKYVGMILKPNLSKIKGRQSLTNLILQDYALGSIGRFNFNQRLGMNSLAQNPNFTIEDLLSAALYLVQFVDGNQRLDDIDDLKHKRIKRVAETVHEHIQNSFIILNRKIQNTLTKRGLNKRPVSAGQLFFAPPLNLERFFTSYELSQFLDQTNPLADIVHKRKVSSLGPGGLTPRTARFRVRDIHPSQYGRICPIETAEGEKAGIVTALTTAAYIDTRGRISNLVYAMASSSMKGQLAYSIAHDDEYARIATGRSLNQLFTPVQHRREFTSLPWSEVNFRSLLPLHFFSIGVGLIPFFEHDDSTRALMGSNMQRQAVTLVDAVSPIVGTGIEAQIGIDSGTILTSEHPVYIEYVDRQIILSRSLLNGELYKTNLLNYARLNNNIGFFQKPLIQAHDAIEKGQLLADSNATVGGELALGQNVLVAYMPWEGYNFEDAILLNERLVNENVYTSVHIERYETEIRITNEFCESLTKDIPQLSQYLLRHLDTQGLVKIGKWVEPGDVLVGKLIMNQSNVALYGPESRLLQEIFGTEAITTQEKCLKVPLRGGGRILDVRSTYSENTTFGENHIIQVYILQRRSIQVGDKLAGRHGNKGVVSKILPRGDMPYLADGTPVDMVLSPLGVPSRMNVGQIFECLLGFSGAALGKNYRILPFDERYEPQASRKLVLSELYTASQLSNSPWIFETNTPGKMCIFDGRTGELFDQPVTVGKAYMFKLIHQVDDKIHARSTGPYAIVTQQPLRGKSRQGGQRVGEMEVWAFQGFGAAYALQELLTLKSDHIQGRATAIKSIVHAQPVSFFNSSSDCLRAFIRELWSLGLNINQTTISQHTGFAYMKQL